MGEMEFSIGVYFADKSASARAERDGSAHYVWELCSVPIYGLICKTVQILIIILGDCFEYIPEFLSELFRS